MTVGFVTWFCAGLTSITAHPFIGAEVGWLNRVYETLTGRFARNEMNLGAERVCPFNETGCKIGV